ncbi:putative RDD family membrane protein YckC [Elusimicrobium simillimum]|uniref:RDD family protein n=1 Tax=Elusimicrobium simillimum TaxID=3143438 RepID=UPI003C6F5583
MQELTQPAAAQQEVTIAPISERIVAFVLDIFPFYIVPLLTFLFLTNFTSYAFTSATLSLLFLGPLALFFFYAAIFNSGGRVTLGKWLMGIKVVSAKEGNINIVKGIIRAVGYYAGFFFWFAGFALAAVTKRKRALHDFMAGSMVISTREKTEGESIVIMFLSAILLGAILSLSIFAAVKMPSPYSKQQVRVAEGQIAKLAYLQEVHKKQYGGYTSDIVRLGLISGDPVQFNRDMQRSLRRKGFKMGATRDRYKITAVAKDSRQTKVTIEK